MQTLKRNDTNEPIYKIESDKERTNYGYWGKVGGRVS